MEALPLAPMSLDEMWSAACADLSGEIKGSVVLKWVFWRGLAKAWVDCARGGYPILQGDRDAWEAKLIRAVSMFEAAESVIAMLKARPAPKPAQTTANGTPPHSRRPGDRPTHP